MLGIEYFRNIVMVVKIVLNNSNSLNFDISLCYNQYDTNTLISNLLAISLVVDNILGTAGFVIYFVPYIGIGITTMHIKYGDLLKEFLDTGRIFKIYTPKLRNIHFLFLSYLY